MEEKHAQKSENEFFTEMKFDVEHALNIYALSFCTFPASCLYNAEIMEAMKIDERNYHIYLIGYVPNMSINSISKVEDRLTISIRMQDQVYDLNFKIPESLSLKENDGRWHLEDESGQRFDINQELVSLALNKTCGGNPFLIKYIGQSYGKDGSRNAIDRLMKHETLQKIALKGVPEGYTLQVILLELQLENRVFTLFYPNAENSDCDGARRDNGLDKLFGTSTAERVSLFEAALIRYFAPEYNKIFKDNFPSTKLSILRDCYEKDFLALVSEICIDNLPYYLCSEAVSPAYYHVIKNDLQDDKKRRQFFFMD